MFAHAHYLQTTEVTDADKKYGLKGHVPALLCLKDNSTLMFDGSLESLEAIRAFIEKNQYPALITLHDGNARDILMGDKTVVLGLMDPTSGAAHLEALGKLKAVARAFVRQSATGTIAITA